MWSSSDRYREADVLTIESTRRHEQIGLGSRWWRGPGGVARCPDYPAAAISRFSPAGPIIVVRHHLGHIVAVIEIISPGNKDSRAALRDFVDKTLDLLRAGVHVLIFDLFPPTLRDPYGIHKAVWDEIEEEDFTFPEGKDRILVSYETGVSGPPTSNPLRWEMSCPTCRRF